MRVLYDTPMQRRYMTVAALMGWFALALQLYLVIARSPAGLGALAAAIVSFFSFFTILTNLLVALVLSFSRCSTTSQWGSFLSRPSVQTATATYIAIVGAVYSALLRELWNPVGAQKLADVLLHDAMPLIYVLFWVIWVPKDELRWKDAVTWLVYPAGYLVYLSVRGAFTDLYPYHFIDVTVLGYPRVLMHAVLFFILFLSVGLVAVAVGRWTARRGVSSLEGSKRA